MAWWILEAVVVAALLVFAVVSTFRSPRADADEADVEEVDSASAQPGPGGIFY
jgi:hypothetical protein